MLDILNDSTSPILPLINVEKVRSIALGTDEIITGNEARGLIDYLLQVNSWLQEYQIKLI